MKSRNLQRSLNKFTRERLHYVTPLQVDGRRGPATNHRIQLVKYYLGFARPARTGDNAYKVNEEFMRRLRRPNDKHAYKPEAAYTRAARRRRWQRAHTSKPKPRVMKKHGIGTYDGRPVANAAIQYLKWAREHGWRGRLNSG